MLANPFRECQSPWTVLESASFTGCAGLLAFRPAHARLVCPQSFPHLWKNLWKITWKQASALDFALIIAVLEGAKLGNPYQDVRFVIPGAGRPAKWLGGGGRKLAEADFQRKMNLWDEILARIETKVNRHGFYTWFKPTTFVTEDNVSVTVRVPDALFKDWLTKHYSSVINEAMGELKRANLSVNFVADAAADGAPIHLGPDEAAALQR